MTLLVITISVNGKDTRLRDGPLNLHTYQERYKEVSSKMIKLKCSLCLLETPTERLVVGQCLSSRP